VGLIDDEDDGLSLLLFGLDDGLLDLAVDSAFGESWGQPQEPVDVIEEIGPAEG